GVTAGGQRAQRSCRTFTRGPGPRTKLRSPAHPRPADRASRPDPTRHPASRPSMKHLFFLALSVLAWAVPDARAATGVENMASAELYARVEGRDVRVA